MNHHLHNQANALLYQALQRPPATRRQYLDDACGARPDLVELVNSMLSHIDQLDAFLEDELAGPPDTDPDDDTLRLSEGDLVGRWRVLRELEHGALGTLLLVQAEDGRRGALRIVDATALGLEQLALYQRERELLASLTHPDIAHLIDSGKLPDGRPYVVVEHSDGQPIDAFCTQAKLAEEARIALVNRVGMALHHAHQRLVVHGRLNTENILVDPDGAPKLGGFGLAALSGGRDQTGALHTTGTDIAALGTILRTLLADGARVLPAELERIAAKAASADPARQYGSADQVVRDLQRYLDPQPPLSAVTSPVKSIPVSAPPAAPPGMSRRWLAGVSVALLVGAGAGAAAGWQAGQQHAQAGVLPAVEKTAVAPMPDVADVPAEAPQAASASVESPASTIAAGQTAARLLQEAATRHSAGDLTGARERVQQALDLSAAHQHDAAARALHADALELSAAVLIENGEGSAGLAQLRKALSMREELAGESADTDARAAIAHTRIALADGLVDVGAYAEAESTYKLAREFYLGQAQSADDSAARVMLGEIDLARANALYLRKHWRTAGLTVRAMRGALPDDASPVLKARAALLEALLQPGGTAAQAYAAARKALPTLTDEYERDQANVPMLRHSAMAWRRTGEIAARAGQQQAACDYYALAEKRYVELEFGSRLNELDKSARAQLGALRGSCS